MNSRASSKTRSASGVAALVTLVTFATAGALIDEPFDYELTPDPNITGKAGGTGWAGAWTNRVIMNQIFDEGLTWGPLVTTGRRVRATGHGAIHRPIGSTLVDAGLLDDGATVWLSFIADIRDQGIITNLQYHVALATDPFLAGWGDDGNGNERYTRMNHLLNNGEGIGISAQPISGNTRAQFRTSYWQDNGGNDNDAGDGPDGYGNLHKSGDNGSPGIPQETILVVARIDWGADAGAGETITLYLPGEDFWTPGGGYDLGDAIQTETTPALDQSLFDTVSIMWKDTPGLDEIRLGATLENILPVPPDTTIKITSITSIGGGTWELTMAGEADTGYEFRSSPILDFSPGSVVENLTPGGVAVGTIGGSNDSVLTTDGDGNGTARMTLSSPRDFVRAQIPPPVTLFSENFDGTTAGSLPADWTTGKNAADNSSLTNWELGIPANVGPIPPGVPLPSGSNCVATNISGNYDDPVADLGVAHTDIWLRSPAIDLGAATAGTLSFQQWTQIEDVPGDLDYGSIRILDASDNSELAVMEDRTIDGSTTGWEEYSMALPAAAFTATAGTIKVEFRFEADDIDSFAGWYIDDVTVTTP